ncbi:MAG: serine/threonine-protein kinase, partial [Planctomycetota bacterium]|nr:serine/threonine-protein kinase [Planctomycetota bacterium]
MSDNPKLSQYIIDHQLGEGGMGIVYQAQQQNLRRKVALKMLQPSLEEEPELVEQFVLEAMVTGRLEHPNIVPVHDLGKAENDRLFMGMKLVRGESLKALLKREPNDSPKRLIHYLDILSQVGDAMAYAHAEGILHRDLKPENVMVGKFGEVQVMDWGLAFAFRAQEFPELKQLAGLSSGPSGTPAYMSPEQAEGKDQAIGAWSDVYLLGAMLYEILTGTPPHRGKSVLACLLAAQAGEVERPSDRAPKREIPYDLEELCMDALAAAPEDRIQSVEAFQAQIKIYQSHREALSLIDRARQILHDSDPKTRRDESAKKAQWILTQALEIWPEAEAASELLCQTLLIQIDRCLEQGYGAEALDLIEQLPDNPAHDP